MPDPDPELVRRGLELQAALPPTKDRPRRPDDRRPADRPRRRDTVDVVDGAAETLDLVTGGGLVGALFAAFGAVVWLLFGRRRHRRP